MYILRYIAEMKLSIFPNSFGQLISKILGQLLGIMAFSYTEYDYFLESEFGCNGRR